MDDLQKLDPLGSIFDAASSAASSAASAASGAVTGVTSTLFGFSATKLVIIVLGLLFVAAGIFSFDKTRDVIVGAAKTAAIA